MQNKIDYSAFFKCPEPKSAYITAKYGLPHEELKQIFIYIVAHYNRIQIHLNQSKPWLVSKEDVIIKLIDKIRSNKGLREDIPVFLGFSDSRIASVIHDIMDF